MFLNDPYRYAIAARGKARGILSGLAVTCTVTLIAGCGTSEKERILQKGYELFVSNNYCSAYDHYQSMLKEKPSLSTDTDIMQSIEASGKECVKHHIKTTRKLLGNGSYDQALQEIEKARKIEPSNKSVTKLLTEVRKRHAEWLKKIENHDRAATAFMEKKEWQKAIHELKAGLALNPRHSGMADKLTSIEEEIRRSDTLTETARGLLKEREWRKAVETFEIVLNALPDNRAAREGIETARRQLALAGESVNRGNELAAQGRYTEAEQSYRQGIKIDPSGSEAREGLASLYARISAEHEERGYAGTAAYYLNRSLELRPDQKSLKERLGGLESQIQQRIEYVIAVSPFKEYSKDPDLSEKLSKSLLQAIHGKERGFIRSTDHKALEKALEDLQIPLESLADLKKPELLKGLRNIHGVVIGKVVSFKLSGDKNRERHSKKFQSGTRQVRNPEYDTAVAEVSNAEARAEAYKGATSQLNGIAGVFGKMASGFAGGADVGAARAKLAQTPEYLNEPVFSTWNYTVITHIKKAEARIAIRVLDAEGGVILAEETLPVMAELTYDTVDNPKPEIGIEDKQPPNDVDEVLKNELVTKAVATFSERFEVLASRVALKFYQRGEKFRQSGKPLDAAEEYMNFRVAVGDAKLLSSEIARTTELLGAIPLTERAASSSTVPPLPVRQLTIPGDNID